MRIREGIGKNDTPAFVSDVDEFGVLVRLRNHAYWRHGVWQAARGRGQPGWIRRDGLTRRGGFRRLVQIRIWERKPFYGPQCVEIKRRMCFDGDNAGGNESVTGLSR